MAIRTFTVSFDNSKKRKPGTPHQSYEAEGVEFSTGHVIIDTIFAPRPDYADFEEMQTTLQHWGKCDVTWAEQEVSA